MKKMLLSLVAITGLASGLILPATVNAATNTYNLENSATLIEPGLKNSDHAVQIVANDALATEQEGKYGGDIVFSSLNGTAYSTLNLLSADYQVKVGDCGGGSPRFYNELDTDNNGTADKRVVYYFTQDNSVCGQAVSNSGNLAEGTDSVQVSNLDGTEQSTTTVTELKAAYPTAKITTTSLVADFNNLDPDGQTVVFDNISFTGYTYTFEKAKTSSASKEDCKEGGYKDLKTSDNKSFKNQGDCVSYYASNSKANSAQKQDTSVMSTIKKALSNLF